jgi:prolyl 4-hydroxylase
MHPEKSKINQHNQKMAKKSGNDNNDKNEKQNNGVSSLDDKKASGVISFWPALLIASLAITLGILTPAVFLPSSSSDPTIDIHHHAHSEAFATEPSSRHLLDTVTTASSTSLPLFPCTQEVLQDYWHDEPVRGFHIACLEKSDDGTLDLTLYKNGVESKRMNFPVKKAATFVEWADLRDLLQNELGLPSDPPNFQPWATFSPVGHRLLDANNNGHSSTIDTLQRYGTFLIFEGGQWLWPGVRVGFKRQANLYSVMPINSPTFDQDKARNITIETLSLSPLVVSVQGFLSNDECEYIQETAGPTMAYSGVVLMDKDAGRPASDFRTSQSTFLSSKKHKGLLQDIDHRTASLTRIPWEHQEQVQVLRYGLNEKYDSHTDFFDPSLYKNDPGTLQTIGHGRRNRLATVFWYLSTVESGGETSFPRHNGAEPRSMQECSGLLVKPEKGKVIIFYSLYMDGGTDNHSLHAACPVKEGT